MDTKEKTLCWSCENTNRFKCSWFDLPPKEVDGWIADVTYVLNYNGGREAEYCESRLVRWCPNYIPLPKRSVKRCELAELGIERKTYMPSAEKRLRGMALRNCRLDHKLSQSQLGAKIGKKRGIISAYEYGKSTYDLDIMRDILNDIDTYIEKERGENSGVDQR